LNTHTHNFKLPKLKQHTSRSIKLTPIHVSMTRTVKLRHSVWHARNALT